MWVGVSGSVDEGGGRALLMSMERNSSLVSGAWVGGFLVELRLKNEKRVVIAGLVVGCSVDDRWNWLDGRLTRGDGMMGVVSKGLSFSFVGEGTKLMLTGCDSPWNQLAILLVCSVELRCVSLLVLKSLLPAKSGRRWERVGEACRSCSIEL